jgi:hypothetical protein
MFLDFLHTSADWVLTVTRLVWALFSSSMALKNSSVGMVVLANERSKHIKSGKVSYL